MKSTFRSSREARKCATPEELLDLAGKHKLPLPDEALDVVAGGAEASCGELNDDHRTVDVSLTGDDASAAMSGYYKWPATLKLQCVFCAKYIKFNVSSVNKNDRNYNICEIIENGGLTVTTQKALEVANKVPYGTESKQYYV